MYNSNILKILFKSIIIISFIYFGLYCSSDSKKSGKTCPTDTPPEGYSRICGNITLASNISASNKENASVYVIGQEEGEVKSEEDGYFEVLVEMDVSGTLVTKTSGVFDDSFFVTDDFEPSDAIESEDPEFKNYDLIILSLNSKYGKMVQNIQIPTGINSTGSSKNLGNLLFKPLLDVTTAPGQNQDLGNVNMKKTGSITGVVTLEYKSEPEHVGIDVYIPGTSFIAKTDGTGAFAMTGVPEGTYMYLRSEKDGYKSSVKTDIVVNSDEATTVEDQMLPLSTGSEGWVLINDGAETTTFQNVTLTIGYTDDTVLMWITEDKFFFTGGWQPAQEVVEYEFVGLGEKTIYIRFADANGLESSVYSDSIEIIEQTEPIIICLFDDADKTFDSGCMYQ